jgi:hypothetical protein
MRQALALAFVFAFAAGCTSTEKAPAGDKPVATAGKAAGKAAPAAAGMKADLDKIKASIAAAKTGDDFLKVTTECGSLEIKGAMSGKKIAQDPEYQAVCKVLAGQTRAKLAISESKPNKMSTHCLSASMNLEDMIKANIEKAANEKLLADLKKACGL